MALLRAVAALPLMAAAAAAAAAHHSSASTRSSSLAAPLPLTPGQTAFMAGLAGRARVASAAATPVVLEGLDAPSFRAELLRCCPDISRLPAASLLKLLEAEIEGAELIHNFMPGGGGSHSFFGDANLTGYSSLPFFANNWQSPLLNLISINESKRANFAASVAEIGLFGLAPFSEPSHASQCEGWPASLAEASERPVYTWLNAWKINMWSNYGTVAMAFRTGSVRHGTFMSPLDSGGWEITCNHTWAEEVCTFINGSKSGCTSGHASRECDWDVGSAQCLPKPVDPNATHHEWGFGGDCDAVPAAPLGASIGTMDDWHHVLVENTNYHTKFSAPGRGGGRVNTSLADRLGTLFGRTFAASNQLRSNISTAEFQGFLEANILANRLSYPDSVKFVLASFDEHWGSAIGLQLRAWCARWRWPLVWSKGGSRRSYHQGTELVGNFERMIDLPSLSANGSGLLNITVPAAAADLFAAEWGAAAANRTAAIAKRTVLSVAPCNTSDPYQEWSGSTLSAPGGKPSTVLNKGAGLCISQNHAEGGFGPSALQLGPPCMEQLTFSNGSLLGPLEPNGGGGGGGGGRKERPCLDNFNGVGPVVLFPCHPSSVDSHQHFDYAPATGLLHNSGQCITVAPDPAAAQSAVDGDAAWARLRANLLLPRAFVVPASPRGCADMDGCIGMQADEPFGDCVCMVGDHDPAAA